MSILKNAATCLEYYYEESIPSQETIGMHVYIDAIREAHDVIEDILKTYPELSELHKEKLKKLLSEERF